MARGRNTRMAMIIEWVGPRCLRTGINRSISGMIETKNSRGIFTLESRRRPAAFPVRYPKARCPTAYARSPSYPRITMGSYVVLVLIWNSLMTATVANVKAKSSRLMVTDVD